MVRYRIDSKSGMCLMSGTASSITEATLAIHGWINDDDHNIDDIGHVSINADG